MEIYKKLKEFGKVKLNEPLFKHTSIKIGGVADFFIFVDSVSHLVDLLNFLRKEDINYIVLGGGTNTLLVGERFEGVVISTVNVRQIKFDENKVTADAGSSTAEIARMSIKNNLTGFEWGICVPGTIGGATCGNAGAMGYDMRDSVEKVEVYRDGEILELSYDECEFGYRDSIFKHNTDIILRVFLKLEVNKNKDLAKEAMNNITHRNKTQPQGFPSSGCVLKNVAIDKNIKIKDLPEQFLQRGISSTGWLIDQAGMKGESLGGAKVSETHCNFVINAGGATTDDIVDLIEKIKDKVYDKFGIKLEEEVRIIHL